jgi:hypothetical protein
MGTYKQISRTGNVTIKATEGGLATDIESRKSDKYDLINQESADGDNIGVIKTQTFIPQPRGVFKESLLEDSQTGYRVNSRRIENGKEETSRTIPLKTIYNDDKENITDVANSSETVNSQKHNKNYDIGTSQPINDNFFFRADIGKRIDIKLDLSFKVERVDQDHAKDKEHFVEIRRINHVGANDELTSREVIFSAGNPQDDIGVLRNVNIERTYDLIEGESLAIVFLTRTNINAPIFKTGNLDVYFTVLDSKLVVTDIEPYVSTTSRCIKPIDLFERIVAKITGKNDLVVSSIFGVGGEYEYMVCDNGFWARGFPDSYIDSDEVERTIQFNTSFKDAFQSFNYLEPLVWFIDIIANKQVVRIETAKYTMQNFIGVVLPEVDNIEHQSSKPDYFSSVSIGHKQTLDYEEINGLDEPNGKSDFNTHITLNESKYIINSTFRFDPVGYELIRRIQFVDKPKEDTTRDSHIWIHDGKVSGSRRNLNTGLGEDIVTHNLWTDRFDSAPTGIFDPDTAWNLWLSPMNRLFYGHGYSIKRGLYHFTNKKVRFSSSNANENLKTIFNGVTLSENGNITVGDIEKPRVEANKTILTFKMTQAIENQLQGFTEINNILVPNYFGLIEYEENGETMYGRLNKLDSKDESKLIMQNARL